MAQKVKTLQDIFRERQMRDMKREYYWGQVDKFFILMRRLALVSVLAYGGYWLKEPEHREEFKEFLNAPIEKISNFSLFKDFGDGMGVITDTLKTENGAQSQAYHEQRQKTINEYKKMGIDATVKYAEPGTKEYKQALEAYRKEGVFNAGK